MPLPGEDPEALDARWLRRSFERAAASSDDTGVLPGEVRAALLARLELTRLAPRRVLDLGAGTGDGAHALKRRYPAAQVVAVDAARAPLKRALARRAWFRPIHALCADALCLPFADASIDLIVSHFLLPFCECLPLLTELRRVLAPGGYLSFSTLGPDTLRELKAAWAQVDAHPHVLRFLDMHEIGDALLQAGFVDPVMDVDTYTVRYASIGALMRDLKASGARNAARGRLRGLMTPRRLQLLARAYEPLRREGRLPATCEVVFGQAWAGERAAAIEERGTVAVPLAALVRRRTPRT